VIGQTGPRTGFAQEDDAVVDAAPVAAQRMLINARRQQGEELLAQRVKDAPCDGNGTAARGVRNSRRVSTFASVTLVPAPTIGHAEGRKP
jgi:hypothetical protein